MTLHVIHNFTVEVTWAILEPLDGSPGASVPQSIGDEVGALSLSLTQKTGQNYTYVIIINLYHPSWEELSKEFFLFFFLFFFVCMGIIKS